MPEATGRGQRPRAVGGSDRIVVTPPASFDGFFVAAGGFDGIVVAPPSSFDGVVVAESDFDRVVVTPSAFSTASFKPRGAAGRNVARMTMPSAAPPAAAPRALWPYLVYPLLFGGAVTTIVTAVGRGVSYWRVGPPVVAACVVAVALLERVAPYARAWQRDHGDTRTDVLHLVGNLLVSQASVALYGAARAATGAAPGPWPVGWPFALQFLAGVAVFDFGLYAVHRASHSVPWLWRLHAIHHSARRLYWVNGQRRHLAHEALEGAPGLLALGALGAPAAVVACAAAAITVHLLLQHGNVAYRAGWLRYVFAVAELHRWHHQRHYVDVQGNYGALFSVWDYAFGTALPKKGDAPPDVGLDDEPGLPADYAGQLVWPFRRRAAGPEHP